MPMVQITLFVFQLSSFLCWVLGRTLWCAVKGSPDAGPDTGVILAVLVR